MDYERRRQRKRIDGNGEHDHAKIRHLRRQFRHKIHHIVTQRFALFLIQNEHTFSIDHQVNGTRLLVVHETVLLNVQQHLTAAFGGKGEMEALLLLTKRLPTYRHEQREFRDNVAECGVRVADGRTIGDPLLKRN